MKKTILTVLITSILIGSAGAYYIGSLKPIKPPQVYTVSMQVEGWQTTIDALKKMPYEQSEPVITAIVNQINTQIQSTQTKQKDSTVKKH
jgi:hypothetical protein